MKTITVNGKQYSAVQPKGMSDAAFKSMVVRNDITSNKVNALAASLNRGK
jgi:hypothetical protein